VRCRRLHPGSAVLAYATAYQLMAKLHQGEVQRSEKREYGRAHLFIDQPDELVEGLADGDVIWMSHGDAVVKMPHGFVTLAHSENSPHAAIKHKSGQMYGVQFHPEVHHTPKGKLSSGIFCTRSVE